MKKDRRKNSFGGKKNIRMRMLLEVNKIKLVANLKVYSNTP